MRVKAFLIMIKLKDEESLFNDYFSYTRDFNLFQKRSSVNLVESWLMELSFYY
jgi:hypothetical protein